MPNTLTLDNWFGASFRVPEEEEGEQKQKRATSGGDSVSSSRRNSGLAPLPDVDLDEDEEDEVAGRQRWLLNGSVGSGSGMAADELRDVEEAAAAAGGGGGGGVFHPMHVRSTMLLPRGGRPFSMELATRQDKLITHDTSCNTVQYCRSGAERIIISHSLRVLLFGNVSRGFSPGWPGQAFSFSPSVRFGFRQSRGGPCGVLASVQAHLVRALCFGAAPLDDATRAVDPLAPTDAERAKALAAAITQILLRCSAGGEEGEGEDRKFHFKTA